VKGAVGGVTESINIAFFEKYEAFAPRHPSLDVFQKLDLEAPKRINIAFYSYLMGRDGLVSIAFALLVLAGIYIGTREASALGGVTNTTYSAQTFTITNGSAVTTGGYVYTFNISTEEKTYRWVGLWGNVTGEISMKAASNEFYNWPLTTITASSVLYATTDGTGIDPTNFENNSGDRTDLEAADTAYGYDASVLDSINNTYDTGTTFQSPSMDAAVNTNSTAVDSWTNYMLKKAGSITSEDDIVWAVEINPQQTSFNGEKADYELLIPENEEAGDGEGTATTYYLWMELN
jgi:hypothetical protein